MGSVEERYCYKRKIRCPYCKLIFLITEWAQQNDETFKCPHCHLANAGSCEADEFGVLIGVSIMDYEIQELCAKGGD